MRSYWRMKPVEWLYQVLIDLGTTSTTPLKKSKQKKKREGKYLCSRRKFFVDLLVQISSVGGLIHNNYKIVLILYIANVICFIMLWENFFHILFLILHGMILNFEIVA